MRVLLVTLLITLAGCTSDDGALDEGQEDATFDDIPMADLDPRTEELTCTAMPGPGVVRVGSIGGCGLGSPTFDSIAQDVAPGDGCSIQYDQDPDGVADGEVTPGTPVKQGWNLIAFCGVGTAGENAVFLVEEFGGAPVDGNATSSQ